jgi:hypothetical protein
MLLGLTFRNSTFCPQTAVMYDNKAQLFPRAALADWLLITEMQNTAQYELHRP